MNEDHHLYYFPFIFISTLTDWDFALDTRY